MPIYMDVHIVPGVKARDVAVAHRQDLLHQDEHGCKCMTYWIDEGRESIFCLIEAPTKEAVEDMHRQAHGLVPHKIIEVKSSVVESFLGRIYDPEEAKPSDDGIKVFEDPSFRFLLVTRINDPILLRHQFGIERADEILMRHHRIIRDLIKEYSGREVEHGGSGFIVSFNSASKAVGCAIAVQKAMKDEDMDVLGFRVGLNAGEPVENSNRLFGDTIQLAERMCAIARKGQVAISSPVKELVAKDQLQDRKNSFQNLSPADEELLQSIYTVLENNWHDPEFDIPEFCQAMAMSKSQLYRKTIGLTGHSPNILLKDFRLEKAKQLMGKQHHNIAQVTFDSGFSSPSYFTKCFKKKYGILPMSYLELLH